MKSSIRSNLRWFPPKNIFFWNNNVRSIFFYYLEGFNLEKKKKKKSPKSANVSKQICHVYQNMWLALRGISQQPLIRFRSNFARCSKIRCSVIWTRIFYFEVKLPSKIFFFNFPNFSWKIGHAINKKIHNFPKDKFNTYILVQITT